MILLLYGYYRSSRASSRQPPRLTGDRRYIIGLQSLYIAITSGDDKLLTGLGVSELTALTLPTLTGGPSRSLLDS